MSYLRTALKSRPERREALADTFQRKSKGEARARLIEAMKATEIRRILTLPGEQGICAREFREHFPDAIIVGIDHQSQVVKSSTLVEDGILDAFFQCSVGDFLTRHQKIGEKFARASAQTNDINLIRKISYIRGSHDAVFLDYCGNMSERVVGEVHKIISPHLYAGHTIQPVLRKGGILAITLSLVRDGMTAGEIVEHFCKIGLTNLEYLEYETTTQMMVAIFQK